MPTWAILGGFEKAAKWREIKKKKKGETESRTGSFVYNEHVVKVCPAPASSHARVRSLAFPHVPSRTLALCMPPPWPTGGSIPCSQFYCDYYEQLSLMESLIAENKTIDHDEFVLYWIRWMAATRIRVKFIARFRR